MMRIQIQLTDEQHRQLKRWAERLGILLSEAVRRCVAERLAGEALAVVGKYADPQRATRVARGHDDRLAHAYGA
jgi:hypothetical protein